MTLSGSPIILLYKAKGLMRYASTANHQGSGACLGRQATVTIIGVAHLAPVAGERLCAIADYLAHHIEVQRRGQAPS